MAEAPRVSMIDPAAAAGDVATLFGAVEAMLGRIPHSYRVLAQSPLVAKMLVPFNAVLQRQGAGSVLTTRIKEMVVIKTSRIHGFPEDPGRGPGRGRQDQALAHARAGEGENLSRDGHRDLAGAVSAAASGQRLNGIGLTRRGRVRNNMLINSISYRRSVQCGMISTCFG